MFGMSMTEVMIILVVALIVLGPQDLPKAAKTIGKTIRDIQKAGDDLKETFQREIMDEPTKPKAPPPGVVSIGAAAAEQKEEKQQPPELVASTMPDATAGVAHAAPQVAPEGEGAAIGAPVAGDPATPVTEPR